MKKYIISVIVIFCSCLYAVNEPVKFETEWILINTPTIPALGPFKDFGKWNKGKQYTWTLTPTSSPGLDKEYFKNGPKAGQPTGQSSPIVVSFDPPQESKTGIAQNLGRYVWTRKFAGSWISKSGATGEQNQQVSGKVLVIGGRAKNDDDDDVGDPGGGIIKPPGPDEPQPPNSPNDDDEEVELPDCTDPFKPEEADPFENPDERESEDLEEPTQVELVAENLWSIKDKFGFDTFVESDPPKKYLVITGETSMTGGDPESPVGGTFVDEIVKQTGQRIRTSRTGNPSYYGYSKAGAQKTETTLNVSFEVSSYDDCPNEEPDTEPGIMNVDLTLSEEYTTAMVKADTVSQMHDFKGDGYYQQITPYAEWTVSADETQIYYAKTKYKIRVPEDVPRPYQATWVEEFTPKDEDPDDDVYPEKEYEFKSAQITGDESQTYTIDPADSSKEGTWVVYLIPVGIGADNNRDGFLDLNSEEDVTSSQKPYRFWLNNDQDNNTDDTYSADVDHPETAIDKDLSDTEINQKRDLDDMARIHFDVSSLLQQLKDGTLTLGLKWSTTLSGNPSIRLYKAVGGGTDYLSDEAKAADQVSAGSSELGVVNGSGGFDFPTSYWSDPNAGFLLFEAIAEGKGELKFQFKQGGTLVGEGGSLYLELLDIRSMYKRVKIALSATFPGPDIEVPIAPAGVHVVDDTGTYPFLPAWDEDVENKSHLICVHGWRKTNINARSDEITMFKRMWHRGFKGRYIGFYWPTLTGNEIEAKFNHSEYRAWKCGEAFKNYVNSLPSDYDENVMAHSLGNVVVGSALNQGLVLDNFAMLNAAIPAQCFDPDPALKEVAGVITYDTGYGFPLPPTLNVDGYTGGDLGDDPLPRLKALAYRDRVGATKIVGDTNIINFYLPKDSALAGWEANQWNALYAGKPENGYDYDVGVELSYDFSGWGERVLTDKHEAMSMANQSMTKPAGNKAGIHGSIDIEVDMETLLDPLKYSKKHQAAFELIPSSTWEFYGRLMSELKYFPTP